MMSPSFMTRMQSAFLMDGDIIESGTHEELLANGGFYADLYNSQFEAA